MRTRLIPILLMALFAVLSGCKKSELVPIQVEVITMTPLSAVLEVDKKRPLKAAVTPANAINTAVVWMSDNKDVAKVDADGMVTAVGVGKATITATTKNSGKTATCAIEVTDQVVAVKSVQINKAATKMIALGTESLSLIFNPSEATNKTATWHSSNESVATVDATGEVTAIAVGEAAITAITEDGGHKVTCQVTVAAIEVPVTSVAFDLEAEALNVGETKTLEAKVAPEGATNQSVTWESSDATIATVDQNGMVKAIADGPATITATTKDGGFQASCVVTVSSIVVEGISLEPTTATLYVNDTKSLVATVTPENASDKTVVWSSSDPEVATVNEKGLVKAMKVGVATITATSQQNGMITASCDVTVSSIVVDGITLKPATAALYVNDTKSLVATVTPENASDKTVVWSSSDPEVATVVDGVVTARKVGPATITATTKDGRFQASCVVTVSEVRVSEFAVSPTAKTLSVGGAFTVLPEVFPKNASEKTVTWVSSNPTVATVDPTTGAVKALTLGSTNITGTTTDGGKTATCEVEVAIIPVTGVTFDQTNVSLKVGRTLHLAATIAPADATERGMTWKSNNPAVATVTHSGVVTIVGGGQATITTSTDDGSKTASCNVTGLIAVTGVTLNKTKESINTSGTFTLAATVAPANASDKNVTWNSSNTAVATVDQSGVVRTTTTMGTATITVTTTDENKTASCVVSVNSILVDNLKWAAGNLVANGTNGCKIGAPTDCGLYFHFGSLVGWSSGANGDGVGTGSPALALKVRPVGYRGSTSWPAGYYNNSTMETLGYDLPADAPETGIGDPCRYYLGGTWRTPTADEWLALVGRNGVNTNRLLPLKITGTTLSLPGGGFRGSDSALKLVGNISSCWSSSVSSNTNGYGLNGNGPAVTPQYSYGRLGGLAVRCVMP